MYRRRKYVYKIITKIILARRSYVVVKIIYTRNDNRAVVTIDTYKEKKEDENEGEPPAAAI